MADRGAMATKANAIQTPKARRAGKNISGVYQKKPASQLLVWIFQQLTAALRVASPLAEGRGEISEQRIEIDSLFDKIAQR